MRFFSHPPDFMGLALNQARLAALRGEIPVGAVLTDGAGRQVLALAGNRCQERADPLAHAEMLALRAGLALLGGSRLTGCDLYVTLEPCALCAAAISLCHLRRLYFAAYNPKGGAVEHGPRWFEQPSCLHRPEEILGGIRECEATALMATFFCHLRSENKENGSRE